MLQPFDRWSICSQSSHTHVIIGMLFQGILVTALPVVNVVIQIGVLPEVLRIIISNGIILYALSKAKGENQ